MLGRTTCLLLWRVRLTVWLLDGWAVRRLLGLLAKRRLLLCVVVLSVVRVIVLGWQSRLTKMLRLMRNLRLPVLRPLLWVLLVLRIANWTRLRVLLWRVLTWVLRTIWLLDLVLRWLLGVAVGGRTLVVRPGA